MWKPYLANPSNHLSLSLMPIPLDWATPHSTVSQLTNWTTRIVTISDIITATSRDGNYTLEGAMLPSADVLMLCCRGRAMGVGDQQTMGCLLATMAALLVYHNSLNAGFVYDDR